MSYSPEEVAAFAIRDKRIARQAVLKSFIECLGNAGSAYRTIVSDFNDPEFRDTIKTISDDFVAWIYQEEHKSSNDKGLPEPTADERTVLEAVLDWYKTESAKLNLEGKTISIFKIRQQILKHFGKYPTRTESVNAVVSKILLDDVLE